MEEDRVRIQKVNGIFIGTIGISLIAPYILSFFISTFQWKMTMVESLVISQVMFIIPALIYVIKYRINLVKLIRIRPINPATILLLIIFAISIQPAMTLINLLSQLLVDTKEVTAIQSGLRQVPMAVGLLVVGLLPAICEEGVYRGIFYHEYRKVSIRKAIVVSGLLFGVLHMNINQFAYAVLLGMVFALVVEVTGSIISSVICHFIINATSVVASYHITQEVASKQVNKAELISMLPAYVLPALIGIAISIVLIRLMAMSEGRTEQLEEILNKTERTEKEKQKIITIPLALTILFCIILMIQAELM